MKRLINLIFLIFFFSLFAAAGLCISGEDIIKLKKAGVSDTTVQLMVKEKTIETCAFTVEEIVNLKKAKVSDRTIQMLITEGSFTKNTETIVYGKDLRPIKFATVKDIIKLKNSGLSEKTIQAIISVTGKTGEDSQREKAWEMLKSMEIHIEKK